MTNSATEIPLFDKQESRRFHALSLAVSFHSKRPERSTAQEITGTASEFMSWLASEARS